MMISATGSNHKPRTDRRVLFANPASSGFSLLELSLALILLMLFIGAAAPAVGTFSRQEKLRHAMRDLSGMAKTARHEAISTGKNGHVIFDRKKFIWQPDDQPREDEKTPLSFSIPSPVQVRFKKQGDEKWSSPIESQRWIFGANGLCEPLRFRLISGDAWAEIEFGPLTGGVVDEAFSF